MNNNNKENIDVTKTENNNSKSQMNYKNINTVQTNHNKKYIQYIKPLLLLLQKAEQIINIINLPSSSIDKYNQLKEISFKKCGLEFTPLVKNENFTRNIKKENNNNDSQEKIKENEIITMSLEMSELKSKLIESLLTIIETTNFSTNLNPNKNQPETSSLTISFNTFSNTCNIIKEEISKKITSKNNQIISEKEKLLSYISRSEQNIISLLFENTKKFKELKESYFILNSKIENLFKYINSIDELISPIWNKYYTKELEWFDATKISDNYELKTYTKSHFLLNFMNQLFLDNKNIMEALSQMEQKKNEAYNILQLPYVRKAIEKGQYLKNVENLLNKLKKEKEKNNNIDMNKLIKEGKELINCIKETISEESDNKNEEKKDNSDNNVINTEEIDNYNDDMNIFLGKLMNGIQNILNKVDISIKKDELIENMMKVNNISKNKNLDISSINNINTNLNNTNMNINTTINNGTLSKDISFISTINNDNNKTQNMSFQVYQKKTNHISGSSINKNSDYENSDKKNKNEMKSNQKLDIKRKVFQKQRIEKINENPDNNNNKNDIINDKILIQSINNIINNDEQNNDIKNKNINNIKIINDDMTEEKAITVGDIGNNLSDAESSQKNKSLKDSLNSPLEENSNPKKEKDEQGIENLKNMVLEDFKIRINEEKENNE